MTRKKLEVVNLSNMTTIKRKIPRAFSILVFLTVLFSCSSITSTMAAGDELANDLTPLIKVYKDGRIERLNGTARLPPLLDRKTGVQSKDIVILHKNSISARLYLPNSTTTSHHKKLPVLVYFHGGGFCTESAASPNYHRYLNSLTSAANVVSVSVNYRLAPENPLPIAYEDSWIAVKWVASHINGKGGEDWLNKHGDFQRLYFNSDSAGANIAHRMGLNVGAKGLGGAKLAGIALMHPFFWGKKRIGDEASQPKLVTLFANLWHVVYPSSSGPDDPHFNPEKDPKMGELGCGKVMVGVAEEDVCKSRGLCYSKVLKKRAGYKRTMKVVESKGVGHVFHLLNPTCAQAAALMKKIVYFLN